MKTRQLLWKRAGVVLCAIAMLVGMIAPVQKVQAAAITITEQPTDVTVEAGDSVTLHVGASGTGLKYQW